MDEEDKEILEFCEKYFPLSLQMQKVRLEREPSMEERLELAYSLIEKVYEFSYPLKNKEFSGGLKNGEQVEKITS